MVGVIGAAALFAACQPTPQAGATAGAPLKMEAKPVQTKAVAKAVAVKSGPSKTTSADAVPASAPAGAPGEVAAKQQAEIITTVAGCLERDGQAFQLTDTVGDHAPKARSWKSGFVKKGSASVDVLDAGNRLNLASHVGHRVTINGTLIGREMRARSLRASTEACD